MKRVIAKVAQVATACQSSEARSRSATGRSTRRARRRRRVLQLVPRDESGSSVWHPSLAFPPHLSDQPTTRPLEPFFKLSRSRQAWRTPQALIGFWSLGGQRLGPFESVGVLCGLQAVSQVWVAEQCEVRSTQTPGCRKKSRHRHHRASGEASVWSCRVAAIELSIIRGWYAGG